MPLPLTRIDAGPCIGIGVTKPDLEVADGKDRFETGPKCASGKVVIEDDAAMISPFLASDDGGSRRRLQLTRTIAHRDVPVAVVA